MEDYEAVRDSCKHCAMIGASITNTTGHVRYGEESISDTWIRGMTPLMAPILDLDLTAGRMVNENDEENRSQVGVIGTDVVDNLFPSVDPLGKEIRVEGEIYRVIGVGKEAGNHAGTKPRQLRGDSDHDLSETVRIAHQHSHFGQGEWRGHGAGSRD